MMNCKSTNHDELTSQLSKAAVHLDASADRLREMKTDILHAAEQSDATQKQQDRLLAPVLEQWEQLAALCEDVCCLLDSARQRLAAGNEVQNFAEVLRIARLTVNVLMDEQQRSMDVLKFFNDGISNS